MAAAKSDPATEELQAMVTFSRNRPDQAARVLEQIIRQHGPTVVHWELLGDTYDAMNLRNKARQAWLRATELAFGPACRTVHEKLATAYEATKDTALANRQRAREALGGGILDLREANPAGAKVAFEKCAQLDPEFAWGWFYLGEATRQLGDTAAARLAYNRCLELQPHHGRAADALTALDD
jgi:Flp pilus assembly protein TadD